ncbi:MAG: hypothetical protein J3K34DRAFT_522119 [Monoraphidium minutum]|nr:MAG: hypothetical protein J3K34DRAFT_522119 [Monoraphidium minutum]
MCEGACLALQQRAEVPPPPPPAGAAEANRKLLEAYDSISSEFDAQGLDPAAVAALQPYFDHTDPEIATLPWPKAYTALSPPLPPRAVRLLVAPLSDNAPGLAALAARVAGECLRVVPPGFKVFANARADLHITLFQLSQFQDSRPDTLSASGGANASAPNEARPAPGRAQLEAELAAAEEVVGGAAPLRLELERVVLARSGTLLLTWSDPGGTAAALRDRLRDRFPGASAKQPFTVHTSLWRLVGPAGAALPGAAARALADEARRWTEKVRGRPLEARVLWHVIEAEFSTIRGERQPLIAGAAAAVAAAAAATVPA